MIPTLLIVAIYLEDLARRGVLVTYSEILKHFGLPAMTKGHRWSDSELFKLFGQIDKQDIAAGRPLRTSSVVQKKGERKTIPSDGYFTVLCNGQDMPVPRSAPEKQRLHATQLRLLREYYGFKPTIEK